MGTGVNMTRKLASIQRITNIRPIEGADKIEQVSINGWNVVTRKGEFTDGELCVYMGVGGIVPQIRLFDFLRLDNFLIKQKKINGIDSCGICLPLSILPSQNIVSNLDGSVGLNYMLEVGYDVTHFILSI